ncbi:MAG: heavy metal-binding domain-containing protein [Nocardioidaceae bacterium]
MPPPEVPDLPPWDGRGLPPIATRRLARAADSGVATSLLSVPAATSLAGCGFRPVGEVMGCIVQHIGWAGYGCGYAGFGASMFGPSTVTSGGPSRWAGLGPYVKALYHGWDTALTRMLAEADALGADGVVGVRLTETRLDAGGNHEFLAIGTGVRGDGETRAARPFATDLDGQDLAKLLHGGWAPTGIAVGISAAVRHDDYRTLSQARSWSNAEISGYTELVSAVRHDARAQLEQRAARLGGEAGLVSEMSLSVWEHEQGEGHRDHYARATVTGTVATQFHRGRTAPTSSLRILPLRATPKESTR